MNEDKTTAPSRRLPRKATRKSLENAALHYLERFSTSRENLRRVLSRRVRRSAMAHGTDPAEGARWIDEIVEKLERLGILDDRAYAETRVASLRRRGVSSRVIRAKLRIKGVEDEIVDTTIDQAEPDLTAAIALARKRGLGPFRTGDRAAFRERDLSVLARAGFSYDVALEVVDAESAYSLEGMSVPGSEG